MSIYKELEKIEKCSVCGCPINGNRLAVAYKNSYICNFCYREEKEMADFFSLLHKSVKNQENCELESYHFFQEEYKFEKVEEQTELIPKKIVEFLNKNVVGQEHAKKTLAVAIYNHYRRINAKADECKLPKCNILMQGPTGSGKTFLIQKLAKMLDVPFYIADSSIITEAGYKGNDPEAVLTGLYQAANCDIEKTEKGIVYLDEFDKLNSNYGHSADANTSVGVGVQRQILKMIEGTTIDIPKSGVRKSGETVCINTENILFVCGGAFVGIDTNKQKEETRAIGFHSQTQTTEKNVQENLHKLTPQDFVQFGFIPELIGRLPIIVQLKGLAEDDLKNILLNTEDSLLKSYQGIMKQYDVELVFSDDAIDAIVKKAYMRKTGARGLNAVIEDVMQDLMYEIPSDPTISKCVITEEMVLEKSR